MRKEKKNRISVQNFYNLRIYCYITSVKGTNRSTFSSDANVPVCDEGSCRSLVGAAGDYIK